MSFIQDNILLIVGILIFLIIIEGLIIYVQYKNKQKRKRRNKGVSSGTVSREKYEKVREERDEFRSKYDHLRKQSKTQEKDFDDLKIQYQRHKDDYGKVIIDNSNLKNVIENLKIKIKDLEKKIKDLTRDNEELNKLPGNEPAPNVTETVTTVVATPTIPGPQQKEESTSNDSTKSSTSTTQDVVSVEAEQKENGPEENSKSESSVEEPNTDLTKEKPKVDSPKERTMYASFPRSAGSNIYFSDLSDKLLDDSYFELTISIASGKASFRPLDFMKIRNYDPAMAAMLTEGVKPNVASTVIGIEPGKAHIEGKDWIIDNLAKIKLA